KQTRNAGTERPSGGALRPLLKPWSVPYFPKPWSVPYFPKPWSVPYFRDPKRPPSSRARSSRRGGPAEVAPPAERERRAALRGKGPRRKFRGRAPPGFLRPRGRLRRGEGGPGRPAASR